MVQHFIPKGKETKDMAATVKAASGEGSRLPSQAFELDLSQYHVLLLDRSSRENKAFTVTETQKTLREVDPHDWLKAVAGQTMRVVAIPRAGPHSVSSESPSQQRKRLIPRRPGCQSAKKQKLSRRDIARIFDEDLPADPDDESDDALEDDTACELQSLEVANLDGFFDEAFKSLGQLACKDILRAWIKKGHPNKQTSNPYNGGPTKRESMHKHGFGGAIKAPGYWPSYEGWREGLGCRHLEPDHLWKKERLICLKHLLCSDDPRFALDTLRLATAKIELEIPNHFTARSIKTLKQIYHARAKQIQYEKKEIDSDALITVSVPKPSTKARKASKPAVSVHVKREPPLQSSRKQATSGVPVANMGTHPQYEGKARVAAQKNNDFEHDVEVSFPGSRTASARSSTASGDVSIASTQSGIPVSRSETPLRSSAPIETNQRQLKRRLSTIRSHSQSDRSGLATADQADGLSPHGLPQEARRQSSITNTETDTADSIRHLNQGRVAQRISSSESNSSNRGSICQWAYPQMRANRQSHHDHNTTPSSTCCVNSSRQPVAPKPMTFLGSSSGLAGLPLDNTWQTAGNLWTAQEHNMNGPVLNTRAGPEATFPSYPSDVDRSFGSDFANTDSSAGSGLPSATWGEPLQTYPSQNQQALEAQYQQQYRTYLPSSLNTLSLEPGCQSDSSLFHPAFRNEGESRLPPVGQSFGHFQW